jgi:hypothetical protein
MHRHRARARPRRAPLLAAEQPPPQVVVGTNAIVSLCVEECGGSISISSPSKSVGKMSRNKKMDPNSVRN